MGDAGRARVAGVRPSHRQRGQMRPRRGARCQSPPFDLSPPLAARFAPLLLQGARMGASPRPSPSQRQREGGIQPREGVRGRLHCSQPSPLPAPLLLTHKGPPGESHQQGHHDASRLEPSLDTGCPRLVRASEVKRFDEPAEGRNGADCSWQEILAGSGGAVLPCSLEDASLAPSLFCNGPGECRNNTQHRLLPCPLAPGKVLPRTSPKCKHFFGISALQPYLTPQTMQGWREEHFPTPCVPYGSLFVATRSQLQEMSLLHFNKPTTASASHVFEGERGNSGQ